MLEKAAIRANLAKSIKAHIGRRRKFCVLGPEYAGCINSGARAKIFSDRAGYCVMIEGHWMSSPRKPHKDIKFFRLDQRAKAIGYFVTLSMRAALFNAKVRGELIEIKKDLKSKDPSVALGAALRVGDLI